MGFYVQLLYSQYSILMYRKVCSNSIWGCVALKSKPLNWFFCRLARLNQGVYWDQACLQCGEWQQQTWFHIECSWQWFWFYLRSRLPFVWWCESSCKRCQWGSLLPQLRLQAYSSRICWCSHSRSIVQEPVQNVCQQDRLCELLLSSVQYRCFCLFWRNGAVGYSTQYSTVQYPIML